jgi:hypothetical protein
MAYRKWQLIVEDGKPRWSEPLVFQAARDAWDSASVHKIKLKAPEGARWIQLGPCVVYPENHAPVEIGSVIFFYLSWTLYRAYTWYHVSRVVETYNFLIGIPKAWVPS